MDGPLEVGSREIKRLTGGPLEVGSREIKRLTGGPLEVGSREIERFLKSDVGRRAFSRGQL
jgi:hypothetical protein